MGKLKSTWWPGSSAHPVGSGWVLCQGAVVRQSCYCWRSKIGTPVDHRRGPQTDRLILRAFEIDDAEAFYQLNSSPEVTRYTGEADCPSVEAARAAIEAYPDFARHGFGRWATVLGSTGQVIGMTGLKRLEDWNGEVDLGYRFLPEYWGRGLATEASRAALQYGFEVIGLERIIGLVMPDNTASIRVLEKVGMQREKSVRYDGDPAEQYAIDGTGFRDLRLG